MNFQDKINELQDRVLQNLCGAAKLMMIEDQEKVISLNLAICKYNC